MEDMDFLLCGNPANHNLAIIFEKTWVFKVAVGIFNRAISLFPTGELAENLLICTKGIPSSSCLKFLKNLKAKKIVYLGDLDPTSFFTFLTLSYAKRKPNPKDKPKVKIKYTGITLMDYKEDYLIKIPEHEKVILSWVERFRIPELRKEIEFLKRNGRKIEMEGICQCWKIVRGKDNIHFKLSKAKLKKFEEYLRVKLEI